MSCRLGRPSWSGMLRVTEPAAPLMPCASSAERTCGSHRVLETTMGPGTPMEPASTWEGVRIGGAWRTAESTLNTRA